MLHQGNSISSASSYHVDQSHLNRDSTCRPSSASISLPSPGMRLRRQSDIPESRVSPVSVVLMRRTSDEERWMILRAKETYESCTKKLEKTVSDTTTKKYIRTNRMRYAFVWIFLTMNGLEEPLSDYSSRIRDVIVNANHRRAPEVSLELMEACNAKYARHSVSSTTQLVPPSVTSMQVKFCLNIAFDEDAQSYQIEPADPNDRDPMLNIAPFLLEVNASGTCIDEMKLLLQTPWTLDRSASLTIFLRGIYVGVADVRVEKSAENYGRRHEISIPRKLRELLKSNEPTDVKALMCLEMHGLSVFLNQVLQHAFKDFRPVSRLYFVCQFSKSIGNSARKALGSNRVVQIRDGVQETAKIVPLGGFDLTPAASSTPGIPRNMQTGSSPLPRNTETGVSSYSLLQPLSVSPEEARADAIDGMGTSAAHSVLNGSQQSSVQWATDSHSGAFRPYGEEYLSASHLQFDILSEVQSFYHHTKGSQTVSPSANELFCPTLGHPVPDVNFAFTNFDETLTEERTMPLASLPAESTGIEGVSSLGDLCAQSSTFTHWNELGVANSWQDQLVHANYADLEDLDLLFHDSPDSVGPGHLSWPYTSHPTSTAPAAPPPQQNGLGQGQVELRARRTLHFPLADRVAGENFNMPGEEMPMRQVEVDSYMESVRCGFSERPHVTSSTSDMVLEGNNFLPPYDFLVDDAFLDLSPTGSVLNEGTERVVRLSGGSLPFLEGVWYGGQQFPQLSFAHEGIHGGVPGLIDARGQAPATAQYVVDQHTPYPFINPNGNYLVDRGYSC